MWDTIGLLSEAASYKYSEGDILPSGGQFLKGIVVGFTAIRLITTYRALTIDRGNTDGMRVIISWIINMIVLGIVFSGWFNGPTSSNPPSNIEGFCVSNSKLSWV